MEAKSELDLSGKLIIKVQLGDDIRRIPIHNEAITYDELVLMMQRVFRGKLTANDDITLKYKDDDGDLITIFDSADLSFAIQCSRILKLQILLNNEPSQNEVGVISKSDLKKIKVQLQSIRNQVNQLLDLLASAEDNSQSSAGVTAVETAAEEAKEKPPMEGSSAQINKVNPSEFDPLKDKINKSNGNVANENKEQPKPTPTPPTTDRQQVPTPNQQHTSQNPSMVPTAAANISDYYNRTGYPQISTQYGNVPYPQQQYSYGRHLIKAKNKDERIREAERIFEERKHDFLHNHIKLTNDKIKEIEEQTREQSNCDLWHEIRKRILTASNFYSVCSKRPTTDPNNLVQSIVNPVDISFVKAVKHGRDNEDVARKQLEKQIGKSIKICGLFIHKAHNFLGASPDGLIDDDENETIIEIKCPLSSFNRNPLDGVRDKKITFWNIENNKLVVNTKHKWFYQIQGQLQITEKRKCLLAVWTGKNFNLLTEVIKRDDTFWKLHMEKKLKDFYLDHILPEIIDPQGRLREIFKIDENTSKKKNKHYDLEE